ncbi:HYR domain-containing protein [Streptomyces sp. NBC_01429]|uniref:HYR domain-containing protein n=1 Tax=Streptomyces sp. NBC_01429 TaxID=2903862 RepID=UPI002E2E5EBF|nr:HYR domain-containing protein [Streptomyces sp. NBC_01429]
MAGSLPSSAVEPPGPENPVTPAVVTEGLDPGGSARVDKQVLTPTIPPKPDIVLLVDGTLSMEVPITDLKRDLPDITDAVLTAQPDSRFAVATYGDQQVDADSGEVYSVLQGLTHDLAAVTEGVNKLDWQLGQESMGPAEDWINGLWQITDGSGGETVFREDASPIVVLIGDASSHNPSMGHTLDDTILALRNAAIRVVGVDIKTDIGDGLNGTGYAGIPGQIENPRIDPDQADRVIAETGGKMVNGVDEDAVVDAILDGLRDLPTTVGHQLDACDPALTVTLDPPTRSVESGKVAQFDETIQVAEDAPQGTRLTCTVQFLLGAGGQGTRDLGPRALPADPDLVQTINIDVNDVGAPVVTVDNRTVRTQDPGGVRVEYTATAEDAVDGPLPVTCSPASGSIFPVGRTEITCTATDAGGNTGTGTAIVEVIQDPVPPPPTSPPPSASPAPPPPPPVVPPTADVSVRVGITPPTTYTGRAATARFTLSNAGPETATGVILTSAWPRTPDSAKRTLGALSRCTTASPCTIPAGGRVEVTQRARYATAVSGDVHATAIATLPDRSPDNNTAQARLRVLQPRLTVTPEVAKPGQVVLARGTDFPPGATVRLSWSAGITATGQPVVADRNGRFEAQVPVLRKDRLGPRKLRTSVTDLAGLEKPVLVVARKLQPPDFAGRG